MSARIPPEEPLHSCNARRRHDRCRAPLPDKWHKPIPNVPTVVGVACKFSNEQVLFVCESPDQKWDDEEERKQPPVRTEREWSAHKINERTSIQRVAHDRIWSA